MGDGSKSGRKTTIVPSRPDKPISDVVLLSDEAKQIMLIKLTVQWKEGFHQDLGNIKILCKTVRRMGGSYGCSH